MEGQGQSLADFFSGYGVNANSFGDSSDGLAQLVSLAQNNAGSSIMNQISGYPELMGTGAPTRSAQGTYWNLPTADGMRYIVPESFNGVGGSGDASFTNMFSGSSKPWTVQDGDAGYYYAKGNNPKQARYSGEGLGLGSEWSGANTFYNVYDQAPQEAYYQMPKSDDSFMGFALESLQGFAPLIALASGPLGGALGMSIPGLSSTISNLGNMASNAGAIAFGPTDWNIESEMLGMTPDGNYLPDMLPENYQLGQLASGGAEVGSGAGGGPLMPAPGMPPAIPGMEAQPFMSASGTTAYQFGTPEALAASYGAGAAGASFTPNAFDPGGPGRAPVEDLSRGFGGIEAMNNFSATPAERAQGLFAMATRGLGAGDVIGGVGGNGGGLGGNIEEWMKKLGILSGRSGVGNAMSMGSGIIGLLRTLQQDKMAKEAMRNPTMIDPMGYGARAPFLNELNALRADPSRVEALPGYKAGLNAVERKLASQGYLASGNMMNAMRQYGTDAYDKEVGRLSELAGARFAPMMVNPSAGLGAMQNNSDLMSRSLASLAYGMRGMV